MRSYLPNCVTGHLAITKLYCSVTEAHVCEQLAQSCYMKIEPHEGQPATSWSRVHMQFSALTISPRRQSVCNYCAIVCDLLKMCSLYNLTLLANFVMTVHMIDDLRDLNLLSYLFVSVSLCLSACLSVCFLVVSLLCYFLLGGSVAYW